MANTSKEGRFWAKVAVAGPEECWLWQGAQGREGYGLAPARGWGHKLMAAHRVAYLIAVGDILEGLFVLHRCDTRLCCNPAHLFAGTHADNMRDMLAKGRGRGGHKPGGPWRVIMPEQVPELISRYHSGETVRALARAYGVNPVGVRRLVALGSGSKDG